MDAVNGTNYQPSFSTRAMNVANDVGTLATNGLAYGTGKYIRKGTDLIFGNNNDKKYPLDNIADKNIDNAWNDIKNSGTQYKPSISMGESLTGPSLFGM